MDKTKENIMSGLLKASTRPDGTMGMDMEELAEMADFIFEQPVCGVDDKTGLITIKCLKKRGE
jgi:hypothetical protein